MEIKSLINKTLDFSIRRLFELIGVILVLISIFLFISLYSYSPEDPNFIFNENTEIKNLLGIKGSLISDIFFQSLGFISFSDILSPHHSIPPHVLICIESLYPI